MKDRRKISYRMATIAALMSGVLAITSIAGVYRGAYARTTFAGINKLAEEHTKEDGSDNIKPFRILEIVPESKEVVMTDDYKYGLDSESKITVSLGSIGWLIDGQ